jgi:acetyltransferase-like isoleucine patch superfamily enzyme
MYSHHSKWHKSVRGRIGRAVLRRLIAHLMVTPRVWGPRDRVHIDPSAQLNDTLLNTVSGTIQIGSNVFAGHGVMLLTGTHNYRLTGALRKTSFPDAGRDILIEEGVWLGSGAIVLGPCVLGANSVVGAGAVVTGDIRAGVVVAGNPGVEKRSILFAPEAETTELRPPSGPTVDRPNPQRN